MKPEKGQDRGGGQTHRPSSGPQLLLELHPNDQPPASVWPVKPLERVGCHVFVRISTFTVPGSEKQEILFIGQCLFLGVHSRYICVYAAPSCPTLTLRRYVARIALFSILLISSADQGGQR